MTIGTYSACAVVGVKFHKPHAPISRMKASTLRVFMSVFVPPTTKLDADPRFIAARYLF